MLNHQGVTWNWSISPSPAYLSDPGIRNPKVVLGTMAFDGDPSTIWHTRWSSNPTSYPHEFQVDMGSRYSVHKFIYLPRQEGVNGRIKKYELYISDDYDDYGLQVATGEWGNTFAPQTVTLKNTKSGRYWKLLALSEVNGGIWASAAEFSTVGCNGNTSGSEISALDTQVSAYPVPTNGLVRLDVPANMEYTYTILSALGKQVGQGEINAGSSGQQINLGNCESGVYLVRLIDKGGVCYWVKVVKN